MKLKWMKRERKIEIEGVELGRICIDFKGPGLPWSADTADFAKPVNKLSLFSLVTSFNTRPWSILYFKRWF